MAFQVPWTSYVRANHIKKRLVSIKPRLKNILDREFDRKCLKPKFRHETIHHVEINERVDDFSREEDVEVVLHGDTVAKEAVSPSSLVVKDVDDVKYCKSPKMKNAVHIVVIEVNPDDESKCKSDLKTHLSEIHESDEQYVVVAGVASKQSLMKKARTTAMKQCKFLETPNSNFECEKCVVVVNLLDQDANRILTRQTVRSRESSPSKSPRRMNKDSQVPSPPKRQYIPELSPSSSTSSSPSSPSRSNSPSRKLASEDVDEYAIAKAIGHQFECKAIDIVERIETFLKRVKKRRDDTAGYEMFTDLDKMLFELKGLYNISETKIGRERRKQETNSKLSKELAYALLGLDHVKGCGRIYGKLDVHVEDDVNPEQKNEVKTAIEKTMKEHNYQQDYDVHFIASRLQDNHITLRAW